MPSRRSEENPPNVTRWIVTYTDLCILLLSFFVLLMSMSVVDRKREHAVLNSLVGSMGLFPGGRIPLGEKKPASPGDIQAPAQPAPAATVPALKEMLSTIELDMDVHIFKEDDKIVIRINQRDLYLPDTFELKPNMVAYLTALSDYLAHSTEAVEIRGHSDSREAMDANDGLLHAWEISVQRARSIYDFLNTHGVAPKRMSAHGFSYYRPLVDGLDFPQFRFKNMRIEVVLGKNEYRPALLENQGPTPSRFFNYKNFFFRLFPVSEKNPGSRWPTRAGKGS